MTDARDALRRELARMRDNTHLRAAWQEVVAPLAAYDLDHGTDLRATLEAYLLSGGSVTATAEHLFLHRNSVMYRLQRIRDIAGLDPQEPKTRLLLTLAQGLVTGWALEGSPAREEET
ncbi:MAG: helix-turn-helix domain-containing protein [Chloroflexi bacterium]|nr:helix-turn-helix domain-containing protein [Chloroflexota bacterium]